VNSTELVVVAPQFTVGVKIGFTVTLIVVVVAHCVVGFGVKVYVVVAVVLIAGVHVPVIAGLFVDDVGSVNVPPLQIGATCVNVGVTGAFTVTLIVAVVAH
jgi:hypothetical protein